ncbi:DUF6575 domain-containing protein [Pantoea ananatis]|uniref:DUF6575 domain-containing protein n=1 Tax=Pantoea ananas TaxID=553 RepID=UPI001B310502|nr:DUF6575 domain-containing protein [Pantoea ananatis]
MYYLPETKELGKLSIQKVYSFYDVPRTFLVENTKSKTNYLVYWFAENDNADSWYYAQVNEAEVKNLESGFIQIRDFFLNKNLFCLSTPYDYSGSRVRVINYKDLDLNTLPPAGYFISLDDDGEFSIDLQDEKESLSNVHEIRIFRERSEKNIDWEPIQKIINSWNSLYGKVAKLIFGESDSLIPYTSSIGSYKSKFIAEKNDVFIGNMISFIEAIQLPDTDVSTLTDLGIDLDDFEALLSNLRTYNYKLEIKANTGASLLVIDAKKLAAEQERIQEHNQRFFSSDLVPQADDIHRIIKLVNCAATNELFNEESEHITARQINYYKHAAKLLGLIKSNGFILQPLGWKVFYASEYKEKISLIADAFENTLCGWAWMKFCNVEKITDIDESTASDFLIEKANGLSEDTAKRRAKTLQAWAIEFKNVL